MTQSLWRTLLYQALHFVELSGTVLDLGGSHKSVYHQLFKGNSTFKVANLDDGQDKEYTFDFEQPFPITDGTFDGIVCLNVLEHIFNYQNLLDESFRILKPGGKMVIGVPFLIRYHPSPNDYWRYTEATLDQIAKSAGFTNIEITVIGTGVFGASYSLRHNLYRFGFIQSIMKVCARWADGLLQRLGASSFNKKHYPLGFVVVARK